MQDEIIAAAVDEPVPTSSQAPTLYLVVVVGLVLAVLVAIAGGVWLAALDKTLPDALIALAGVCAGALASMIATRQ